MIRPTIANLAMVTLLAIVGIYVAKVVVRAVPIPGASALISAV